MTNAPSEQNLPFIWLGFCVSQIVFAGISWSVWPGQTTEDMMIVWVLAAMILPMSLMSTFGAGFLVKGEGTATTRYILRWAFAESAALVGFVACFVGGPRWLGPLAAGWGLLLVLLAYPSRLED